MGWGGGGGLFDYSVKPGQDLSRSRLGLVRVVTRTAKAMFGQVGYQVSQVKARARSLTIKLKLMYLEISCCRPNILLK